MTLFRFKVLSIRDSYLESLRFATDILLLSRDELKKRVVFFDNAENKKTSMKK